MDVDLEAVWDACLARANRGSGSAVCRGEGEEGSTAHGYEGAWRRRSVSVKGWDHLPHDAMHFERARHGSASQDEAGHVTSGRYGIGKGFGANMRAFGANWGAMAILASLHYVVWTEGQATCCTFFGFGGSRRGGLRLHGRFMELCWDRSRARVAGCTTSLQRR